MNRLLYILPLLLLSTLGFSQSADTNRPATFKIKRTESCAATLCGVTTGNITYKALLKRDTIVVQGCYLPVISFDLKMDLMETDSIGPIKTFHSLTPFFPKAIVRAIKNHKRCALTFYNITCKQPDGSNFKMNDITLTVFDQN